MGRQGQGGARRRDRRRARVSDARALFDAGFYARAAGLGADEDAFAHYQREGIARGRKPNVVFDPVWYGARNPEAQGDPLQHYATVGEAMDRDPSALFDVAWYRRTYAADRPLAHYLAHRFGPFSPVPEFDAEFYLKTYTDVGAARLDPFQHYLLMGHREFRLPFEGFAPRLYALRRMGEARGENPVAHMRAQGAGRAREAARGGGPFAARRAFARPGPAFEAPAPPGEAPRALVLAFYLPQFHRIRENDAWWGAGFTEWTALARGQPRFDGHYQPRIPGELGFYDPTHLTTLRAQAALARGAGVGAFVFYHYDFGGRRLLQAPVELFLATPDIDIGFCLMWANENWTRRWDGAEHEVLVEQDYSPGHETQRLADFARHFRDPRYLRWEGRPVLMVYRASLIPDTAATMARWRRLFDEQHGETPIFVMAQTFDDSDPHPFGFDAAIEFPPHKLTRGLPQVFDRLDIFDEAFEADVYAYDHVVEASLAQTPSDYKLIKTAVPSWDNDARRQGRGLTLVGSTPTKFARWLAALIERAQPLFGAHVVAINAWNEWSEAAYLEPDVHYGAAYLNAAARAIFGRPPITTDIVARGGPAVARLTGRLAAAFGVGIAENTDPTSLAALIEDDDALDEEEADRRLRALFSRLAPEVVKVSAFVIGPAGPRLASLMKQTHPIWELVVLGDAAALDAAEAVARAAARDVILADAAPTDSVWRRAAQMATGDFVWIVEAAGVCVAEALGRLVWAMRTGAAFAFADRRAPDAKGQPLYLRPSPLDASKRPLIDGELDAQSFARRIQTPPFGALWRREALLRALATVPQAELQALAAEALKGSARAAYVAESLELAP